MSEQKHTRQFEVKKLFSVLTVRKKLTKKDLNDNNVHPAYSSDSQNNGVIGYCKKAEFICNEKTPVYLIFGDHTRTFNIARRSFSVLDNVKVLIPCVCSDEVLLYIITAWQKSIPDLGYARHWKIAHKCSISLPIQTNEEGTPIIDPERIYHAEGYIPDWNYMQERIAELEQERIAELEQYLIATGLNDYELNDEDKIITALVKRTEEFHAERFWALQKIKRMLKKSDLNDLYSYHAYSSDSANNGIIGYCKEPEFICDDNTPVYLTFGDHTRSFNIARKSFSVLDNVKVLLPCIHNDEVLLYIITAWKKAIPNLGYARHWKLARKCSIKLPIQTNEEGHPIIDPERKYHAEGYIPDWDYMAAYIRAMKKVVIADVVKYTDEVIAKTRSLVSAK